MKAEIIATGTELVLGETLNTSTHYLTAKLSALGVEVDYHTTVGDNPERLETVLRQALQRVDLVITTGGLGPTADDLTKELVGRVLGLEMLLDQTSIDQIKQFFANRQTAMPQSNEKQAYFPRGATIFPNPLGTAPGAMIKQNGKIMVILPGPPFELRPMFDNHVWPELVQLVGPDSQRLNGRVLKVLGMGESAIEEVLGDLMARSDFSMTLLAKRAELHIRLVVRSSDPMQASLILDAAEKEIRGRLGIRVFARDDESMVGIVGQMLREKGLRLASAESCTGGLLGAVLTQEPGSSDFYQGGIISYANSAKEDLLGVQRQTLQVFGAVSAEAAKEMASGVRSRLGTDLGLATTGIAGPGGSSKTKPAGLVYIGLAATDGAYAKEFQFYGGRESVRQLTTMAALDLVRQYMLSLKGARISQ